MIKIILLTLFILPAYAIPVAKKFNNKKFNYILNDCKSKSVTTTGPYRCQRIGTLVLQKNMDKKINDLRKSFVDTVENKIKDVEISVLEAVDNIGSDVYAEAIKEEVEKSIHQVYEAKINELIKRIEILEAKLK